MPNPIPSTDVTDFLDNVKDFDSLCNLVAGTYVDRFGNTRLSVAEFFKRNGYETPVAFASGISVSRVTQTVEYGGNIYHAVPSSIPFTTTGTFNAAQWSLIAQNLEPQGITLANLTISSFVSTGIADGSWIHFAGRDTVGDGGGGKFRYSASSTQAADGAFVFAPSGGGRLFRDGWTASGFASDILLSYFAGFDPSGTTSINSCLAAAKAYCDSITVTPDSAGPRVRGKLIIPPGTYLLTADADLPIDVECHGRFIGAYKLKLTQAKRPNIKGLACTTLQISGSWFGLYEDIFADALLIDGGGVGFGTFWNTFLRVQANVTIDLSNWSVNQNTLTGRGGFVTVGSGADVLDGHANNTGDWDFTGGQCSNTSSIQQDALLVSTYYEAGADVAGPYHMVGFQGDAGGPPKVNRRNHIFASYDVIEKNSADFLATGGNMLAGGAWDYLDSNGKPPCINASGATAVAHAAEPFGMKAKYGGNFTAAFSNFALTIPPCRTGKFSLLLAYQSTSDFENVEIDRGGGDVSYGGASVVTIDADNNWKLLRISGKASKTGDTTIKLFVFGGTGGSKDFYIGGMYATQEKAAQYPAPQYIREAHGTVTQGYVSGGTSVDIVVTFPRAFASNPVITHSIESNGTQTANYTKVIIDSVTAGGFTARIYYSGDWAGKLNWFARGLN